MVERGATDRERPRHRSQHGFTDTRLRRDGMAQIVRQKMSRHDDARSLLRALPSQRSISFPTSRPKPPAVRLHPGASTSSDEALKHLCPEINATETHFPGKHRAAFGHRIGVGAKPLSFCEIRII